MNIFRLRKLTRLMNQVDPGAGGQGGGGAAPTPPTPAPGPLAWLGENPDAELLGHVQNAGWKSPVDAVQGHRNLEKLLGADRAGRTIVLPKDDATPAEWADFHTKLGRPGTPDDYKLQVSQGGDPAFAKVVSGWLHENGVPLKAGQGIAAKWNEYAAQQEAAQQQAINTALDAEQSQLKADWGGEYDMRKELARRAAVGLGMDSNAIETLEAAVGFTKVMKALAKAGDLMREHGAEGMGQMGAFGMTPEGAKAKRTQLLADPDWRKKAMTSNSAEWAELQKLDKLIAGIK